jgi:cobalt-zinc-cadmium efflux system outer membrane protein
MLTPTRVWLARRTWCLAWLALSGCVASGPRPNLPAPSLSLPTTAPAATSPAPCPPSAAARLSFEPLPAWSLEQLLATAAQNNPDLAAAQARAQWARGKMIQAGLWPNPLINYHADQMFGKVAPGGEQGMTLAQQVVTAGKLRKAKAAAAEGVAAADWQAVTRWYDVATRVRLAYVELLAAQREIQTTEEVVHLANENLGVAKKLQKAGTGTQPDVLRAQVELEQNRVTLSTAQRRADAAWRLLAAAVGVPSLAGTDVQGNLEAPAPNFAWPELAEAVLTRSSEVQEARALNAQAEQQLRLARAQRFPDVVFTVRPFYSNADQDMRMLVDVGTSLPLYNRNQGNIASAAADVARTAADVHSVELRLTERLALAFRRYQASYQQVESYRKQILPDAAESLRLVRLGYENGDPKYDYTAVLQAQRILVQTRLVYVQALGELWRAVGEIAGLLQQDDPQLSP